MTPFTNLVIGLPAAAAPILSGLAAATWNIPALFTACLVLSLLALAWLALRFKEPRTA